MRLEEKGKFSYSKLLYFMQQHFLRQFCCAPKHKIPFLSIVIWKMYIWGMKWRKSCRQNFNSFTTNKYSDVFQLNKVVLIIIGQNCSGKDQAISAPNFMRSRPRPRGQLNFSEKYFSPPNFRFEHQFPNS